MIARRCVYDDCTKGQWLGLQEWEEEVALNEKNGKGGSLPCINSDRSIL